jgi:hypothetical protein
MTGMPTSDAPLARKEAARVEAWRNQDWQKLWLAVQGRTWRSLAIVPAGPGAPKEFTVNVATTLARTGMTHLGTPIHVADATRLPLAYLVSFAEELQRFSQEGDLVLVALAAASDNPITVSLAQKTDAALLCVMMEEMTSSDAKKTVNRIGPQRFIGSAMFRPGTSWSIRPQGSEPPESSFR